MTPRSFLIASACLSLLTAGCASEKLVGRPGLTVLQQQTMPAPDPTDLAVVRPQRVGPLDRVSFNVFGAPDLSRVVQVQPNGEVRLPLIGTFQALGKTPDELSKIVEDRIRGRYVRNPDVTVAIDTVAQLITVDGQVNHPGMYPVIAGRMTLERSIASASGVTDFAATNYVVVFRQAQGKQLAALYDLRAIRQGIYPDPEIYANDVVYVGESAGRRLFQTALAGGGLLLAPLITIINKV